ncbi:SspB-related isopeptide-forming adhesin [Streptococcus anginosus]|uniref:SspB-related isopeptide-forming adhesin n=1 Tax=Streptococcus anginosus TaxID=1328 RepID=UPI003CF2E229
MFHNSKTKGHGSIRKNKVYGTIGVLTLGTIAILSAHQGVAADEVKATKPTTPTPVAEASDTSLAAQSKAAATEAASSSTATTVKETTPAASTTTAPAGSTSTADNTTASAATKTESATKPATAKTETPAAAKPSAQTGTTTDVNVDSSELDKAVNDAKKAGVEVKKEADVNHGTATTEAEKNQKVAEIKDDYKKQAEEIKKVTEAAKSDTAKYTEAKAKYDAELAKYNTAKAIYDTAKAKYDTDKVKYDADKANYDINKAKFELDKAKYEQDLTKYYAAKEKYGKDFADYIVAQAKYEKDLQDYNAALAEWEKNKNNDGYIKQKLAQQLIFKSEPHARLSFPGGDKVYTKDELKRYFENHIKNKLGSNDPRDGVNDFNATNDASSLSRVMLRKGQPLVTQYTNLQNSYFKGKKIAKVEYVYTLKDSGTPGLDEIPAFIENDPTKTIWYMSLYGKNTRINMKAYFYDEDGNKMDMTGALVSFSSLNRGTGAHNASPKAANQATIEKVYSFSGDFIHINGSSIDRQYDGGAYSSNDNESIARGSKYNASQWDGQNAPYKWYGAIVGQVTSPDIELEFGSVLRATPWFAFNSDIKANGVPIMPVKPTKPEEPKEPTKPVAPVAPVAPTEPVKPTPPTAPEKPATRTATYHYNTLKYQTIPTPEKKYGDVTVEYKNKDGMTISPKVTDTPRSEVGTDYDTTDQRKETITTVDGKKYRLDPKATQGAETGKVVEGNTNITYYYDLVPDIPTPEKKYGDVTVEYKNKDGMTISPKVTDTPRSEVGTDYDTTDQRKEIITTVDGKKYRLDPKATQGAETGKVVEGNTNITYYYDLVPDAPEEYGNVVVDYQDKKGNTIAPRVVDTPDSKVGTNYDTTDHKPTRITTADGKVYRIDPKATQGQESGKIVKGTTRVVYVYDEVVGDVTVHYKDEDGKVIKEPEKDTTGAPINTVYDTRDHAHKTITTKDGRTYEIVPEKTQGIEQGRVVEGNTDVTYIYKQVFGDVVVHYEDESGKKIKEDVTDTSHARVGEDYDTTDHKTTAIKSGDKIYNLVPEKTKGNEKGKVTKGVTEVTYVYKEVKAEPKKKGTNAKGEDVNGKTMLAGSTEVYTIDIDNDQYKGMTGLTDKDKQAGLMVVEKYSGKYVTPNLAGVRVTTEDGKVQSGFTTKIYKSVAEAPQKVQDYIKAKGLKIDGEFAVTTADDPVAYTNNYVLKGINLKLVFPTTVKKDIKEASKYDNRAYQIDFTGIHDTNLVTNNIPKINPKKDVVATVEDGQKDQNSLNNKTVKVGQVYNFELETSYLPANRGQAIEKMEVRDKYSSLVEYNGVHKWYAKTDILLKNGQKLAKGTDLTQYVNQTIDHKARTVVYSFSSDFLSKISDNSEFQATGYMQVKQLNTGTVKNTFTEIINNVERDSNTVTVDSPQDYGDVVVHYVDESGKKIKEDVTDTSHSKVGENYDTTDHKTTAIKSGDKVYNLVPEKTKGNEKGKVTKGVTEVTYVYKEVKAEPKKKGTNAKGEDVNGKTMLAGSTEVYTIDIDNDQYKGMTGLTDKDKQAGLMVVEKYSGKYVTPNLAGVRVTTEDGKVQSGFTTKIYKSVAEAPQKVQDYIKAKGLKIDGEFAVTTADDPVAYTNNYVLKGINLKLVFPTTVKKDIKEASKYDNRAYQIDFTGIHDTNLVTNNIPKINPKKDVVATVEDGQKDQNSLNNKTVKVGQVYNFELETSYLPANRGQAIEKMEVKDTYSSLVEYNGVHKWFAKTDILLKNGQKIAKGTDLTKFVNQTVDHKTRTVVYSFSSAFLNSISDNSEFQATGYMQVKQLDYGIVKNTFTEIINGVERNSNTVTVVTPDKPKTPDKPQTPPETPKTPEKPQTPPTPTPTPVVPTTPKQPVTPQVTLPSTGESTNDGAALVGLAFAATALSMLGFKKRKEEE